MPAQQTQPTELEKAVEAARRLFGQGRLAEARRLCQTVLATFPAHPVARRLLAQIDTAAQAPQRERARVEELIALYQGGRFGEVVAKGGAAAREFPKNPFIPNLIGAAETALGRHAEAVARYRRATELDPRFFAAWNNLGTALAAVGRPEEALAAYERALRLKPDYAEAWNNRGNVLRNIGRPAEAIQSYARALEIRGGLAEAHGGMGAALLDLGRAAEAVEQLRRALELRPGEADLLNHLGRALLRLGEIDEAIARFEEAVAARPELAEAWTNLGNALVEAGRLEEAETAYRRALEVRPRLVEAWNNLCDLLEKTNRLKDLAAAVAEARGNLGDGVPLIEFWTGVLASRQGRDAEAREALRALAPESLPPRPRLRRLEILARVHDRLGEPDAAFAAAAEMNALAPEVQAFRDFDAARFLFQIEILADDWAKAPAGGWLRPEEEEPAEHPRLAFLVGMPRSGTTLVDTLLLGHPMVRVAEERPAIGAVRAELDGPPTRALLDALDAAEIARLRTIYVEALGVDFADMPAGGMVIDKLPLNLVNAGLIHRLFPAAPFVLALRHPADVVLSCFMQNFRLNDAMANFLTLEGAATLYDRSMRLWCSYREKLPLRVAEVRYEGLVGDPRATLAPVIGTLGLEWDERVLDHRATAAARGRVNTPSYAQIAEELHGRAAGRWRDYRRHLAPVLPMLAPWIAHFGYDDGGGDGQAG